MTENKAELLRVEGLKQHFRSGSGTIRAVDGISFSIFEGETFGLVGESGCGKSTTGRSIIRLYNPTAGRIYFNGTELAALRGKKRWQQFRRDVQMIYQDPYGSLNPRMKIREIIGEGIDAHGLAGNAKDRERQVAGLLETVGLSPEHAGRYPHELSGGQRQRIGIARALAGPSSTIFPRYMTAIRWLMYFTIDKSWAINRYVSRFSRCNFFSRLTIWA